MAPKAMWFNGDSKGEAKNCKTGYKGLSSTDRPGTGSEPSYWDPHLWGKVWSSTEPRLLCLDSSKSGTPTWFQKTQVTWNEELWAPVLSPIICVT